MTEIEKIEIRNALADIYNQLFDISHSTQDKELRKICVTAMEPLWNAINEAKYRTKKRQL